ncbi:MAG: hypothetical protein Q4F18_03150 [Clostridia bacterium]|nr:hypothetical protein [Clostridia bacterium]
MPGSEPDGTTFPVWVVVLESEEGLEDRDGLYYHSMTQYVDARTGQIAEDGERMTP